MKCYNLTTKAWEDVPTELTQNDFLKAVSEVLGNVPIECVPEKLIVITPLTAGQEAAIKAKLDVV